LFSINRHLHNKITIWLIVKLCISLFLLTSVVGFIFCLLLQMKRQQPVVIGNELSDPVVWMDRLSAIYELVFFAGDGRFGTGKRRAKLLGWYIQ